jgi:hypothetical protein
MKNTEIIGKKIEYEASGQVYTGKVMDEFRTLSWRNGEQVQIDLYLVETNGGHTFKISPMQVIRILE